MDLGVPVLSVTEWLANERRMHRTTMAPGGPGTTTKLSWQQVLKAPQGQVLGQGEYFEE